MTRVTIESNRSYHENIREINKIQVMGYLEVNNLITSDQSAYRNQYNTQTALHRVVDDWLYNISDGNLTGVCSFDITKCFDTINHTILLKKMSFYGFKDHASKWFQSYLYKREQIVSCQNQLSGKCQLQIGVPHSVLTRIWIFFQKKELLKFFRELLAKERSYPSTQKVGECI